MVLCGITHTDNVIDIDYCVPKLLKTKLWSHQDTDWKSSVVDNGFQILLVSQFTLYHQLKGTRPDFHDAADHEVAKQLYHTFLARLEEEYLKMRVAQMVTTPELKFVQPGSFGNHMSIEMECDGPVTLVIESVKDERAVKKLQQIKKREAREKKSQKVTSTLASEQVTQEIKESLQSQLLAVKESLSQALVQSRDDAVNVEQLKAENQKLLYRVNHLARAVEALQNDKTV